MIQKFENNLLGERLLESDDNGHDGLMDEGAEESGEVVELRQENMRLKELMGEKDEEIKKKHEALRMKDAKIKELKKQIESFHKGEG